MTHPYRAVNVSRGKGLNDVQIFFQPSSLGDIFAVPRSIAEHGREVLKVTLYLICDEQKEWVIFFYFNPLVPPSTPYRYVYLQCCGAQQGERDMHHSVPVIEGIIPSLLAVSRSITGDSALAI